MRVEDSGFGFRVWGSGFRVQGVPGLAWPGWSARRELPPPLGPP